MSMRWDVVTTWRAGRDGTWQRSVFSGVRVERADGASQGTVGPSSDSSLRVFFFSSSGLRRGDCVAEGARSDDSPPSDAYTVAKVSPWTMGGSYHHEEVECR